MKAKESALFFDEFSVLERNKNVLSHKLNTLFIQVETKNQILL